MNSSYNILGKTRVFVFLLGLIIFIISCGPGAKERIKADTSKVFSGMETSIAEHNKNKYLSYFLTPELELKNNPWLDNLDSCYSAKARLEVLDITVQVFPNGMSEISAKVRRSIKINNTANSKPTLINDQTTYYLQKREGEPKGWKVSNLNYNYNESDTKPLVNLPH